MDRNRNDGRTPENRTSEDKSVIDKAVEKTKDFFDGEEDKHTGTPNEVEEVGDEYQDAPDEGAGDVPTEDKIIRDPDTGEETLIRNANKKR